MSDYIYFGNQNLGDLGYDRWKTDVPEYYDYDDANPHETCEHEEYEINWDGLATCDYCHANWWATAEEMRGHEESMARAARAYAWMERRERLLRPFLAIAWHLWGRWHQAPVDDEIPF